MMSLRHQKIKRRIKNNIIKSGNKASSIKSKKPSNINDEYSCVPPNASASIVSYRAFGYDIRTSIADLIDNSISAGAKNVWLNLYWNGKNSTISLRDDGHGMTERTLEEAMRFGSKNPLEKRAHDDLGRFGLGLKTASFSQCRKLTVASKYNNETAVIRSWDMDYILKWDDWRLLKTDERISDGEFCELNKMDCGTIVLWENLDRICGNCNVEDEKAHDLFLDQAKDVKKHIAMIFHRYLERKRLTIKVNGNPVEPWDPFLKNENATQLLGEESLEIFGKRINVNPYVLPHHSKINKHIYNVAAGPKGWIAQQGFYIYRNERLIIAGSWLGLGIPKEESYKLARIQVDIPNSLDEEWEIDVKKSVARPPSSLRDDLKRIANITIERAASIYRHRGKVIARENASNYIFLWNKKVKHGKIFYSINLQHPLVQDILNNAENPQRLHAFIRLIEETIPVPLILMTDEETRDKHAMPFENAHKGDFRTVIIEVYKALLRSDLTPLEARNRIAVMEPFINYTEYVEDVLDSITGDDIQ